ncbi:sulfurtransferase [Pseudidiomarina mangrovi]|uniref:sulfurtransferase n=1 Tax=Pseudidiomarina mangrovi TaxID=2487133 RepID=UPI000FCC19AD|nr:sulfurtransferase [Pseudidiomarina mangrovi]
MTQQAAFPAVVSTTWLAENLRRPELVLLDCSMRKVVGKEPLVYERLAVIPGAQQLDLEQQLLDISAALPNAFPSAAQVSAVMQALGVDANSLIVLYDNQGIYSAPRAWVILKAMGHKQVAVLDGGLPQWLNEQRATESNYAQASSAGNFMAQFEPSWLVNKQQVEAALQQAQVGIVDARSADRFHGHKPEPRADMRSGHIPGSCNLPFGELMQGFCFMPPEQLAAAFSTLGLSNKQQLLFTCGSGITACILLLAAEHAGLTPSKQLYDGSWAEWGLIQSS